MCCVVHITTVCLLTGNKSVTFTHAHIHSPVLLSSNKVNSQWSSLEDTAGNILEFSKNNAEILNMNY